MKVIGICMCLILLVGCTTGKIHVLVKPYTSFSQRSTITVETIQFDYLNVGQMLTQYLAAANFDVISASVTSHKQIYADTLKTRGMEAYTERVAEYQSRYLLRFGYSPGYGGWGYDPFYSFWSNIVDLQTGKIVVTASYQATDSGRSASDVTGEYIARVLVAVSPDAARRAKERGLDLE